jgi:hypothetical protein
MENKNKDYFWIPFNTALVCGLITGGIYEGIHAFSTSDWAAKGQPVLDRWFEEQIYFMHGFIPGALIGLFIGYLWYLYLYRNK